MNSLDQKQAQFIESHARCLQKQLPEPHTKWQKKDLDTELSWSLEFLDQCGIIKQTNVRNGASVWETNRRSYQRISECVSKTEYPLPCHSGIKNLGNTFTCGKETCTKEYERCEVNWDALS